MSNRTDEWTAAEQAAAQIWDRCTETGEYQGAGIGGGADAFFDLLEGEVRAALGIAEADSFEGLSVRDYIRGGTRHGMVKALVDMKAKPPLAERVSAVQAGGLVNLDDGELLDELHRTGYRPPRMAGGAS